MIKIFTLLFYLLPFFADGQTRSFNTLPKDVPMVESKNVLLIEEDSIYNFLSESELRQKLLKGNVDIITQPDSVQQILEIRIKAIIVIRKKEEWLT